MTLFRIKSAPFVLIEDDSNKNILPLILELVQNEINLINVLCYEQPKSVWRNVFSVSSCKINYYNEFNADTCCTFTREKCSVVIDSVNQMALCMSWKECLKYIKTLQNCPNINRLILVLHNDCILHSSKIHTHLNHLVNIIISYSKTKSDTIQVLIKKGNKVIRTEEILSYDAKMSMLKLTSIVKPEIKEEETEKPLPGNLSTFKIEVDQTDKIQKYNLKLPYMSKIHDGQSKVYYEPDSVDDWDEEDPDEDLDI